MFKRVLMFSVVCFGMVTVAQRLTKLMNRGASSPPLAVKVQDVEMLLAVVHHRK